MAIGCQSFAAKKWLSAQPDAVAVLLGAPAVEVRPAGEGRGLGVFTTRAVAAFAEILAEAPTILLRPTDDLPQLYEQFISLRQPGSDALQQKYMALSWHEVPTRDTRLRGKLAERGFTTESAEEMVTVAGIMQNNAFNVDLGDGNGSKHRALFLDVARLNHACAPNAHVCFYRPQGADDPGRMVVHALRDLQAGEEVLIAYFNILLSPFERREKSSKWGFKCQCAACMPTDATHEQQRKAIVDFNTKQVAIMQNPRPTMKQIMDLVSLGTSLVGRIHQQGSLRPAIPDIYDNLAMLRAKGLLVQSKETQREGLLQFLEQAAIYEANLTGSESPATMRRLQKLQQFAAQKDRAPSARIMTRDGTKFAVEWYDA